MKATNATKEQMNIIKNIIVEGKNSSELLFENLSEERIVEMCEHSIEHSNAKGARYNVDKERHFYLLNSDVALYGFFFEDGRYEAWHSPKIDEFKQFKG